MKQITYTLTLILLLLMLTACTDGGAGIFYSIEKEEKIANKALPDYLSSFSYAVLGTDYYVPAGGLYTWNTGMSDWAGVSLPSGWKYSWNVASDGGTVLYAILENRDGDDTALYSYDGTSWSSEISVGTGRPYQLWVTNGDLYVATIETVSDTDGSYYYRLYYFADTTDPTPGPFTPVTLPYANDRTTDTIRDVDFDGTDVFCITSSDVFFSNGGTLDDLSTSVGSPAGAPFPRFLYASTDVGAGLYLSAMDEAYTGDGYVYKWNAGTWDLKSPNIGSIPNDFNEVDTTGDGIYDYLLVGSNNGYYESTTGDSWGPESSATTDGNYERTELESAAVNGFFDIQGSRLFIAMTSSNGLWRNDNTTWSLE